MDVRYVNKIMHHKFAIIDGPLDSLGASQTAWLVTGSANFSNSAGTRYDENTVFIRGSAETTLAFQAEFNHLWASARDFSSGAEFEDIDGIFIDQDEIEDEPGVQSWFTSANFDVKQTRHGSTLTRVRGRQAVANQLVELIKNAERSIWVASGHMRSRPIAEAIASRLQTNPALDVRIYLDAQEYISRSKQESLRISLQECLSDANTETQRQNCLERGHYFSLDLHDAGAQVRMKWYSYRWHYSYAVQMHHKYLIVDGHTVASGSYNLSSNAEFNSIENMVFYSGPRYRDLVQSFEQNFATIWDTGQAQGLYGSLMEEIVSGDTAQIPIVFEPMALTHKQIADYRAATSDHCSDVNTSSFRSTPQRHRTCTRR